MFDKRGLFRSANTVFILALLIVAGAIIYIFSYAYSQEGDFWNNIQNNLVGDTIGFEEVCTLRGEPFKPCGVLNFVFGKIPGHLADLANESKAGAAIIVIAIWFLFFLIFGDIMNLFGSFSPTVSWTVAGLLTIIGANLKFITSTTVFFLTVLSAFGALSIFLTLALIFAMFLSFHFGSSGLRRWIIERRAQDFELRARVGAMRAGAGVKAAAKFAKEAAEAGK